MLYHHTDGYPTYMLPLIGKAFTLAVGENGDGWQVGRAGKAASFLCAADPGVFEPEQGLDLHGDIQYFYVLSVVNQTNGSMAEKPAWNIQVFRGDGSTPLSRVLPLSQAIQQAKEIEAA
jgi:hypothetical protein